MKVAEIPNQEFAKVANRFFERTGERDIKSVRANHLERVRFDVLKDTLLKSQRSVPDLVERDLGL